jgi:hypothetical protein
VNHAWNKGEFIKWILFKENGKEMTRRFQDKLQVIVLKNSKVSIL